MKYINFKFITGRLNSMQKAIDSVISRNEKSLPWRNFSRLDFSASYEMTGRRIVGVILGLFITNWYKRLALTSMVVSIILISSNTKAQEQNHLNTYLTQASENNPRLKSLFEQYMASLEKLPQAKSLPDPKVMFNLFASPVETRVGAQRMGISISQAFPWFGQLKAQEQVMALASKAFYESFLEEKNRIQYQVKAIYYDLYVLEAALSITQKNIKLLESFKSLANIKLESGSGSAVDVLRVEMQLAELNTQYEYLIDSRSPIRTEFCALLNVENGLPIVLPEVLKSAQISDSKTKLIESMLMENPNIRKLDFESEKLDSEIDLVNSQGKPSFTAGLSYTNVAKRTDVNIPDNGKDALVFPQIGVRIPLYRKKYNAMVKEKTYLKSANAFKKEHKQDALTIEMEKVWANYRKAKRRIQLNEKLANLANQSLDILVVEYTSDKADFEEILRMERQVLSYELELEKARAERETSAAYIKYLTGK